ncbi:MAG: phage major capsid protein [Thermodesulfobacteriota bacterium]
MKYKKLKDKYIALGKKAQSIQDLADLANRPLTDSEQVEVNGLIAEAEEIENQMWGVGGPGMDITGPGPGRKTQPDFPGSGPYGHVSVDSMGRQISPSIPPGYAQFKNDGEFFQSVKNSCARGGSIDPRLIMGAPTTVSTEGAGADGGFLVPPQWSTEVFSTVAAEGALLSYCNVVPVTGNTYVQVLDTGAPWEATNGVQAYWKGENTQLTQSKVDLKDTTKRLHKLTALVPVTEELLEDAPSLDAYLRRKVTSIFDFKINLAIIQGDGAGKPMGILNSSALISEAGETGQEADTIIFQNVSKMWSRLAPGSEGRSIWLSHKDILPQFMSMTIPAGITAIPVYLPAGGVSSQPYASLMSRPIVWTQACESLGDKGDLILADLSQYQVILKTGGMKTDVSMHLFFDWDLLCFRFILRIEGVPLWPAPVTGRNGVSTYSPFVCLSERAG